jgi:hypothetical protein
MTGVDCVRADDAALNNRPTEYFIIVDVQMSVMKTIKISLGRKAGHYIALLYLK